MRAWRTLASIGLALVTATHLGSCAAADGQLPARPAGSEAQPSDDAPRVVLLHSYSPDFVWTAELDEAMRSGLLGAYPSARIHTEYMDTKRHAPDALEDQLRALYETKYRGADVDLVMTTDDNALRFAMEHHLVWDAPIVFAGVNDLDSMSIAGSRAAVTGVVEQVDLERTIALMRRLQPDLRSIAVITDEVPTGRLHRAAAFDFMASSPRSVDGIDVVDLSGLTFAQLTDRLGTLDEQSAVLHLSLYRDVEGAQLSGSDGLALVLEASPAPVYTLWDFWLGTGAVGGHVTSAAAQGRSAVDLSLRILEGSPVDDVPIVDVSPNRTIVDWGALAAHDLDPDRAGSNVLFLDRPVSFYERYRSLVWWTTTAFAALVLLLVASTLVNRRLRFMQRSLSGHQARLRTQNAHLVRLNQDLNDFAYSASHDLKAPLVTASGLIDMATEQLRDGDIGGAEGAMVKARSRCELLADRVEGLLQFVVAGSAGTPLAEVDVVAAVEAAWSVVGGSDELEFTHEHDGDRGFTTSPEALTLILENLLSNAIKHRDQQVGGGGVAVRSRRDERGVTFDIEDDGCGIDPALHDAVGRPFRRFASQQSAGHGLGLALVKRYLDRLEGTFSFESAPGEGTTFTVFIPERGPTDSCSPPVPRAAELDGVLDPTGHGIRTPSTTGGHA